MEEMQVLVKTEWYNCPDCREISRRDQMLTKRTAKLALAGTNAFDTPTLTLVATGALTDVGQATATCVTTNFASRVGDRLLVVVSHFAATASPTSVAGSASSNLTLINENGTSLGLILSTYYSLVGTFPTAVASDAITVTWGVAFPQGARVAVFRIGNVRSPGLDKESSAFATSTSPASGATAALATAPQLCVGMLAHDTFSNTVSWKNGFGGIHTIDAVTPIPGISVATLPYNSKTGINATATLGTSRDWAASVATFRLP